MSEADNAKTLLEALVAFSILFAVLILMANTRLYPLAVGIVIVSGFYVLTDSGGSNKVQDLISWASKHAGGSAA